MELFLQITAIWGVYLGIAVFVIGMGWRIYEWATTPRSPVALGMYPKPKSGPGRFFKGLKDTFVAPQTAKVAPVMWIFAILFHIAALAAFVGHLRLVQEFTPLANMLGEEGMSAFAAWSGGIAGTIMMVAVMFWILRRTFGPYKRLSVPEDYLLLFLLFGVIIMGNHMRFFGHIHAETYMEWFQSLLAFRPVLPEAILSTTTGWSLGLHMLFTTAFLMYFPFSKLTHTIGSLAANMTRSE